MEVFLSRPCRSLSFRDFSCIFAAASNTNRALSFCHTVKMGNQFAFPSFGYWCSGGTLSKRGFSISIFLANFFMQLFKTSKSVFLSFVNVFVVRERELPSCYGALRARLPQRGAGIRAYRLVPDAPVGWLTQ